MGWHFALWPILPMYGNVPWHPRILSSPVVYAYCEVYGESGGEGGELGTELPVMETNCTVEITPLSIEDKAPEA